MNNFLQWLWDLICFAWELITCPDDDDLPPP